MVKSMSLWWIGFFGTKKPIHCKIIDLTIHLTDTFSSNLLILATLKFVKNSLFHNEIWRKFLTHIPFVWGIQVPIGNLCILSRLMARLPKCRFQVPLWGHSGAISFYFYNNYNVPRTLVKDVIFWWHHNYPFYCYFPKNGLSDFC